jgi:uroporphyrinogen decarboxylase
MSTSSGESLVMTKRERVLAALEGAEVDRVPVSAWWHDYHRERTVEGLVEAMVQVHHSFDWDFLKVYPRHSYCVEDWGVTTLFREGAPPEFGDEPPVQRPEDWAKLRVLPPDEGVLGEHVRALRLIRERLNDDAPVIQTISNPLTVAALLLGNEPTRLVAHLHEYPMEARAGLEIIAQTFAAYSRKCLAYGADGIFFATTDWANQEYITASEYEEFGKPYDLIVLAAVRDRAAFNVMHICGDHVLFNILSEYPVHAVHWGATLPHNPSLGQARGLTLKALMGGVSERTTLRLGAPDAIEEEVKEAIRQTQGHRLLLAPGCTVWQDTPPSNLRALRAAVG